MKALSYTIAVILVIGWAVAYFIYGVGMGIHLLLAIAFATVIQQIVQTKRLVSHLFRSPRSKKHSAKFHLTEKH